MGLCRHTYTRGPKCKSEVKYGRGCKSEGKCAHFKRTTKRSRFAHLNALAVAYRDDPSVNHHFMALTPTEMRDYAKSLKRRAQNANRKVKKLNR